jgi:hypothetical protein
MRKIETKKSGTHKKCQLPFSYAREPSLKKKSEFLVRLARILTSYYSSNPANPADVSNSLFANIQAKGRKSKSKCVCLCPHSIGWRIGERNESKASIFQKRQRHFQTAAARARERHTHNKRPKHEGAMAVVGASDLGVFGMGVMGQNLALNAADNGFVARGWLRTLWFFGFWRHLFTFICWSETQGDDTAYAVWSM